MPIEIYKRGKVWHYRGTVAGRLLRGNTRATAKAIAQRIASEAETVAWQSHLDGPAAHVTFAQAAIAYRAAEKSDRFLELVEDHFRDTPLREITSGTIRSAALKLYPNAKGATRNRQVIVPVQAIINHAAELDWCPPIKVRRFKVETKTKEPADLEWVTAFADHASPHLGALCLFMFGTGARIGEATELRWSDLDLTGATVTICQTKVGDTRKSNLPPRVVVALANIPSNRNPMEKVFGYAAPDSVRQVWAHTIERAGIKYLTPHCCRHGFATTLLRRPVDPKTVAKLGGWKDVATVMKHYAHAMDDPTLNNLIFDTELTQEPTAKSLNVGNKRVKLK